MISSRSVEMRDLLKQVSRSFYLTIRILPRSIRDQVGLAYLLARTTDTIADSHLIPIDQRQNKLEQMRRAIQTAAKGNLSPCPDFGELFMAQITAASQVLPAEVALLKGVDKILNAFCGLSSQDRLRISEMLDTITSGQERDLICFGSASTDNIAALASDAELDDYTYRVAGCVGEFWTKMCQAHLFSQTPLDNALLLANGIRFGKGLQLVNILRDLPKDLRQGRCYIPVGRLADHGLEPKDLLDPSAGQRFRSLYNSYLQKAEEHLAAGWSYTTMLPAGQIRLRLACAWPILIGIRTLVRLRTDNVLEDRHGIKLSRSEVRRWILRSVFLYAFPGVWKRLFERALERSKEEE